MQLRRGVGTGGDTGEIDRRVAGGRDVEGRVTDEARGGGDRGEGREHVVRELGLRLEPRGVSGAEYAAQERRNPQVVADPSGRRGMLVGEDGTGDSARIQALEQRAAARQEDDVLQQNLLGVLDVDRTHPRHQFKGYKARNRLIESAPHGGPHFLDRRRRIAKLGKRVRIAAMNGGERVNQGPVQVDKHSAIAHEEPPTSAVLRPAARNLALRALRPTAILSAMPATPATSAPRVTTRADGGVLVVEFAGRWRITEPRPVWTPPEGPLPEGIRLVMDQVESWDSAIVLFAFAVSRWARGAGLPLDSSGLQPAVRDLLEKMEAARNTCVPFDRSKDFLTVVGLTASDVWAKKKEISHFVGECVISAVYLAKHPAKFRWRDCLYEMQACGAMALPIVSLIGFLVGLTLAYTGAVVLRQFGADIWVADLVGLTMVREMGAVMTAIVLAGRTGAAYAATLGNMRANEEIDALETLGIRPVDFLVMPRLVALGVMMPLLALYSNALGILGGMAVAAAVLDIPPTAYWVEMLTIVDLSDVSTGLIKAFTFGVIVGIAGCMRGMQAQRSASGVGLAATSAVVTAILFIIVADALYAVIFNILGW